MSEYSTSPTQDAIEAIQATGGSIATVRVTQNPNGITTVDIVSDSALNNKRAEDEGVHLLLKTTEKAELDISPKAIEQLEKALDNSPVGATPQVAELEKLLQNHTAPESNVPTTASQAAPQVAPATETTPALKITATDPEQAIYSVEMNPAALSEQALRQLEELRKAQAFGAQSDEIVTQMVAGIIKERPDLQPAMDKIIQERGQGHTLGNNAAHRDEQGEGTKIVAASAGSRTEHAAASTGSQMAVAQESFETTVSLPRPGTSSGSLTEVSSHVKDANHQGRVVAEKQAAMAHG
jgi:hypothetical protein